MCRGRGHRQRFSLPALDVAPPFLSLDDELKRVDTERRDSRFRQSKPQPASSASLFARRRALYNS